jgi:transposase
MTQKRKFSATQKDEIRRKLRKVEKKMRDVKAYKRLLALRMYSQGKTNKEISEAIGFSAKYISELVTKYLTLGLDAIVGDKRTSNNYRMSFEQEEQFLEQFLEASDAGQVLTIKDILEKYEEATGKPSCTSTIYALLKRHGWRKLQPRPAHPGKASEEEIESSKKLTQISSASCWKKMGRTGAGGISETATSAVFTGSTSV